MQVTATNIHRVDGTVAVLEGVTADGREVTFAAERRPAYEIAQALDAGEEPQVEVPDWAVLGIDA